MTDGVRLFRVVSGLTSCANVAVASLEDCRTLEVGLYTAAELYDMRLRPVRGDGP